MTKAILSRVKLDAYDDFFAIEFKSCVGDLLDLEDVQRLVDYRQHFMTTRFQHSVNVAYYSYLISKLMRFDYRSAARAGLLHDLFLYDWRVSKQPEGNHAKAHPIVALRNARVNVELNKIEEDAIVKHMWPVTPVPPRYKESVVVSMVDKYCCICEVTDHIIKKCIRKVAFYRSISHGGVFAK